MKVDIKFFIKYMTNHEAVVKAWDIKFGLYFPKDQT